MERNLFSDLTVTELQEVDGGEWEWTITDAICNAIMGPVYIPIKFVVTDLSNAWRTGYNEVMSSTQPNNATVSGGDSI